MSPLARSCSECGNTLAGRSATTKTCSDRCRLRRSRRQRRANRQVEEFAEANNAGAAEVAAIVRNEAPDVVTKIMKDQLTPIVREAITEDVLRAIQGMVGLTPAAVLALEQDLGSEDATVRQRAYSLVIKYTIGHPAIVKPETTDVGQMTVNFNLPRPDTQDNLDVLDVDASEELKTCDMCHEVKDLGQFASGSERCQDCFERWRATIMEQFA